MVEHLLPAVFAVLLWWGSTSLILRLDGLDRATFPWTMLGASLLLVLGAAGLWWSARQASLASVHLAFLSAILVWGWIEVAFLTGYVTGPRRTACPPGARGWVRLRAAVAVILWHEVAILAAAGMVLALTFGAPNQVGSLTFVLLAVMRLSAKLNLFLGVRNLGEALLPDHLRYLETYFVRRRLNALLPLSLLAGAAMCGAFVVAAVSPAADVATAAGFTLLASLVALGLAEHALMVLPIPPEALFRRGGTPRAVATPSHGSRP